MPDRPAETQKPRPVPEEAVKAAVQEWEVSDAGDLEAAMTDCIQAAFDTALKEVADDGE